MTTIYIVTSGSYSDYSINEVFAQKADAERYAATVTDGDVEEYELRESLAAERRLMHVMTTGITSQGAKNLYERSYEVFPGIDGPRSNRPKVEFGHGPAVGPPIHHWVRVEGYDLTTVRQAFSDAVVSKTAELETTAQ